MPWLPTKEVIEATCTRGTRLYFFFGLGLGFGGGGGGTTRTVRGVSSATEPISLVAVTSARYRPLCTFAPVSVNPSQTTSKVPALARCRGRRRRTTPAVVRIRGSTVAALVSVNSATARGSLRGTVRSGAIDRGEASVRSRSKVRSAVEVCPVVSVAVTTPRQRPAGSGPPSAWGAFRSSGYVPGAAGPEYVHRATPSGPTRRAVTVDWRTILYESRCRPPVPESTGVSGAGA